MSRTSDSVTDSQSSPQGERLGWWAKRRQNAAVDRALKQVSRGFLGKSGNLRAQQLLDSIEERGPGAQKQFLERLIEAAAAVPDRTHESRMLGDALAQWLSPVSPRATTALSVLPAVLPEALAKGLSKVPDAADPTQITPKHLTPTTDENAGLRSRVISGVTENVLRQPDSSLARKGLVDLRDLPVSKEDVAKVCETFSSIALYPRRNSAVAASSLLVWAHGNNPELAKAAQAVLPLIVEARPELVLTSPRYVPGPDLLR